MLYDPKDYRTNRKAVLALREKVLHETVTTSGAISMGAKKAQLAKWVEERKLTRISWGGSNRYNLAKLKALIIASLK